MKTTTMIGPLLQGFFVEHLLAHKHVSPRTVSSYRDTFRMLLQFVRDRTHTEPSSLRVGALDAPIILSFLDHLEFTRHNPARSRNVRLAAIRSFFRWVALCDPELAGLATRVLAIPAKVSQLRTFMDQTFSDSCLQSGQHRSVRRPLQRPRSRPSDRSRRESCLVDQYPAAYAP